jgi:hypothetical protein
VLGSRGRGEEKGGEGWREKKRGERKRKGEEKEKEKEKEMGKRKEKNNACRRDSRR